MNPLDQLADINTPTDVNLWPLAWGYWVLIVLCLTLIVAAIISIVRYQKTLHMKKWALNALANSNTSKHFFSYHHQIQVIIKTLCEHYVPEANSKMLHGSQWQSLVLSVYKGSKPAELEKTLIALHQQMYTKDREQIRTLVAEHEKQLFIVDPKAAYQKWKLSNNEHNRYGVDMVEQNQSFHIAMVDLISTSFPCTYTDIKARQVKHAPKVQPQEVTHV